MEIKNWTVRNKKGDVIAKNIQSIEEWLKYHPGVMQVIRLNNIKEIVIY